MPVYNTLSGWGWPAKTLHWLVALLVIGLLLVGFAMVWLVGDLGTKFQLYQLHKSFGVLVLALVLIRIGWRCLNRLSPPLPAGLRRWERVAALVTHRGFYVLLVLMPLTGWIVASTSPLGIPTMVFGVLELPNPVGPDAALERSMALVHGLLAALLALLLALHVAAALKHHIILRDGVLTRMLPGSWQP